MDRSSVNPILFHFPIQDSLSNSSQQKNLEIQKSKTPSLIREQWWQASDEHQAAEGDVSTCLSSLNTSHKS